MWFNEIESIYKGTETARKYKDYNLKFQAWFNKNHGAKKTIQESHLREFVGIYIAEGKSTKMLIGALKFRFNECEKKKFSFKGLNKKSETKSPHKAFTQKELQVIFAKLSKFPEVELACCLLYDMAGRS